MTQELFQQRPRKSGSRKRRQKPSAFDPPERGLRKLLAPEDLPARDRPGVDLEQLCSFGRRARGEKWSRRGGVASGGRWLPRTEARRFAEGSTGCCGTSLREANERGTRAGTARGTDRCPQARLSGRRMTWTVALQLVGVNRASCRWPSGTLSRVPRRRSREARGPGGNGVRFGLCGGDQGTVARLSVVAVAGGPVVAGTSASMSR